MFRFVCSHPEDFGGNTDQPIPLHNVTSRILQKVIDYCTYHYEHPTPKSDDKKESRSDEIIPWDKEFCNVEQATLFELILAANFLDIKPLLDLTCKTVANMIKGSLVFALFAPLPSLILAFIF